MKTLFLYDTFDAESFFFELEGDYSRFHNVYINGGPIGKISKKKYDKLCNELSDLVYDVATGEYKIKKLDAPTRDWTFFVHCGFIP